MSMDLQELATAVLDAARKSNLMLATAESCTGGMIAAALTDIPGSSSVVERGFVTYSNAAKAEMIGVDPVLIERYGAVSSPVAQAMAEGALHAAPVDLAVAVTGIAGPGGSEFKPEGLVFLAIASTNGATETVKCEFGPLGRAEVRRRTVEQALKMLLSRIESI